MENILCYLPDNSCALVKRKLCAACAGYRIEFRKRKVGYGGARQQFNQMNLSPELINNANADNHARRTGAFLSSRGELP